MNMNLTAGHRRLARTACIFLTSIGFFSAAGAGNISFHMESLKEIREKNVVMQRWDTSCAAAALATVLTYGFDSPVSEFFIADTMLKMTQAQKVIARRGFSLLDMSRFVETVGYRGQAYQHLSLEDLKLFHAPIVPIRVYGYNHYVVVNAFVADKVLLADPAFGNRAMSVSQFKEVWMDGIAFIVTTQ